MFEIILMHRWRNVLIKFLPIDDNERWFISVIKRRESWNSFEQSFSGATAGLRVINMVNSSYVNALLQSTRDYFTTLGLLFGAPEQQVRIISGSEEGLSGWISTNILFKQLYHNNQPNETFGVLDMGGKKSQNETDFIITRSFRVFRRKYTNQFLCFVRLKWNLSNESFQHRLWRLFTFIFVFWTRTNTSDLSIPISSGR